MPDAGHRDVRAWRQSLLWLLRSAYVGRMAVAYVVMTRGRHAEPDHFHLTMTTMLFVDLAVFLVAFFEYFPAGRRIVLLESLLRPVALAALVGGSVLWAPQPAASLGWARGPGSALVLGFEFLLAPAALLWLVRRIGDGRAPGTADDQRRAR
mgnify:FL=1